MFNIICPYCQKAHKSKGKALSKEVEMKYVIEQFLHSLPANKDWLDPDIERMAKEICGWK